MAMLSLRISLEGGRVTKTIQFDPNTSVFDACRIIRDKFAEAVQGNPNEYGLFLSDEENKQGVWLESGRNLSYYFLHNLDMLEYRRKLRTLRVRMLDGAVKTILVDDSQPVSQLMVVICTKIGITNHEEYGLVREANDKQNENVPDNRFGTLTLRKKLVDKDRDAKMEKMRQNLKTDDETNWVEVGKTLREQGIDESEEVLLRRKFFYSDQNIDSRDPVQLNLLYVQARDAIINGVHPVTQDKACEFAGIQAQIQFGDYNDKKHQPGFLDLKEFLPGTYSSDKKAIERKIFAEHRKHINLSEIDAKVLYTKTARELPTYGVTFFLVKEKMSGKNKLVPRLLGVTKDSVLRLDEKTKEILKTWPLTTVRRWGASPKTFTLDFGDYADNYYSVQTTEAEQIVQLIAGYIDIILKKKQSKDHFGIEGDEGSTMVEESVAPSKATFLQHEVNRVGKINTESLAKPVIMRGSDGERSYTHGEMQNVQYGAIVGQVNLAHQPPMSQEVRINSVLTEPQRALLGYIHAGQDELSRAQEDLRSVEIIPPIGNDMHSIEWRENKLESSKQVVTTHIASMNAATAQVVTASQPDEIDHEAISDAVSRITQSIPAVTKEVKMLAALMDDDTNGDKLLDATRQLCDAFSDLLRAAEPESKEPRQSLLNAASRVGEASTSLLSTIGEESPESRELHDMLLQLAKAVANTTAALVLRAKSIAASVEDDETRNKVISAASQCALATSQLVACAKVVGPTLQNKACRDQLEAAAREVAKAVSNLVDTCKFATDDPKLKDDLMGAAHEVSKTLKDLLDHINLSSRERVQERVEENPMDNVLISSDLLISSSDPNEMMRQAKILSQATAQLIQSIKGEAQDQDDQETQRRLMAAAKQLADATSRLLEAARVCSTNPMDSNNQEALRVAAEELREITTTTANTPAIKRKLINRLEQCAKQAASAATQCIQASRNAVPHSSDSETKEALLQDCEATAHTIPRLVTSIKTTISHPDDPSAQLGLIEASETFIDVGTNTTSSARALQPSIGDNQALQQLAKTTHNFTQTLHDLRSAATRAREACGGGELESALDAVSNLRNVLNDTRKAAEQNTLRPLPGETPENTAKNLGATTKGVGQAMTYFISTVTHGNRAYAGAAGRDTALALGEFTKSVRGVAATNSGTLVIDFADDVIINSMRVVEEAQRVMQNLGDAGTLSQATRDVHSSLTKTVDCLPGQREVDEALKTVTELSEVISMGEYPPSDKNYGNLQMDLKVAAEHLNAAGARIVQSYASPAQLASSSMEFSECYKDLLTTSLETAGQTPDEASRNNVLVSIRGVSRASCNLLNTAKMVAADPEQPNNKNLLANAARALTESINYLVDVCTHAAPGQKECDKVIRRIEGLRPLLDHPKEAINDMSYYDCFEAATEKSASLGHAISEMINHAKGSQHVEFGHSVNMVAEAISGLIEAAAQSAYLVGVSDPSSVAGRPGLVDTAQLMRVSQSIEHHCDILRNPDSSREQLISALTTIAKQTTHLCNISRNASTNTSNPVAKQQFIYAAKDVATATASLVQKSKNLDKDYEMASRDCAEATRPLLDAVNSCRHFASSPEYVSIPARISENGWKAQEPILDAGRGVLDGVIEMVKTVKTLAVTPDNPPVWQQLAIHSKPVSESVKRLVDNIRSKPPGKAQCDEALATLSLCARELDSTGLSIGIQGLAPKKENTLQGFTSQTLNSASEIIDKLDAVRAAAKKNAESLGHAVSQATKHAMPLTNGSIGACSHLIHSSQKVTLLDQSKTVIESLSDLIQTAKEAGGNPRATNMHANLDECVGLTREALTDLKATVEKLSTENGVVTGLMDQISRSINKITDKRQSLIGMNMNDSFVDYQTRMVQSAKEIARLSNEINSKAATDLQRLPQLCVDITHHYAQLAQDSMGASATTTSTDVSIRIRNTVQELGHSLISLVQSTAGLRPDDAGCLAEVTRNTRNVTEKVSQVLAALQAGSRGTQACINAANTVSGIIGDLDTTIMFATAGTLNSTDDSSFADHREHILKTAKALVEDTKVLVAGAAGTQDELASAAQNAVSTILQLAEAVKRGASTLGSGQPDSQVMTINAVKDVASALGELINATKLASGKSIHDPAMNDMKESARVMVLNVSTLLKTVKAVEDEHTRGTRAMESTVEAISQEIRTMNGPPSPNMSPAGPEELIRVTKNVTTATAKAVAAGASNSQADIVAAANIGRRAISDMLTTCKTVAYSSAETADLRQRTIDAGIAIAASYRDLLEGVLKGCSADERMHLSRRVAKCVTDLVAMAQLLKGSDWVDPEDPTVIAENELLGAAASIDAAAKKLASLRPRRTDVKEADENLKFDEMILEAAKGIMAASSALVRAANAAQRELIDQGKVARRPLTSSDDGQWSEGLISAARLVAAATHTLVEAAQNLVTGVDTEEKLISSAKQVAATTAQLLIACRVKSDPNSESGRRLQAAGNAVIKSTDNLVRAAQRAIDMEEEHILKINTSMVDGMAQEINAQSEVLKMERQLEEARNRLVAIRQAKYRQKAAAGMTTDESDGEGHYYGPASTTNQVQQQQQQQQQYGFQSPQMMYGSPSQQQQIQRQQQYGSLNRQVGPHSTTPASPSFLSTSSSTAYHQQGQVPPPISPRPHILTGNAIPRPYHGAASSPDSSLPQSPILPRHQFNSNQPRMNNSMVKVNLEACVKDLHEKTFGSPVTSPMSTFKQQSTGTSNQFNSNNYQGMSASQPPVTYDSFHNANRYESTGYESGTKAPPPPPPPKNYSLSNMTRTSNTTTSREGNGEWQPMPADGSGQQRMFKRELVTTTTESKSEHNTKTHNFRLD